MEYRTLGNFWLKSPKVTALVYDLCEFVCDLVCSDEIHKYVDVDPDKYASAKPSGAYEYKIFDAKKLKTAINKSNTKKSGCELYDLALSLLPKGLSADINNLLKEESASSEDYDLYKEWNL